jgi:flagellum-specific ATP synthase
VDEALERWPEIVEFLGQDVAHAADLPSSRAALESLVQRNVAAGAPAPRSPQ